MPTISVKAPPLHNGQRLIAESPARFRVVAAGRRWGKTRLGALLCLGTAMKRGRAWWVAPSYKVARVGWRLMRGLSMQIPGADRRRGDMLVTLPGGGTMQVRSAVDPDSLRSEGLDLVVIDEAAFVAQRAWTEALRPALADRVGKALFISTPDGMNWFYELYQRGQANEEGWASWRIPTVGTEYSNPFIDPAEVEAARKELPQQVFEQEFLAAFTEDTGRVFRNVRACVNDKLNDVKPNGSVYYGGLDWAQVDDFTVITVVNRDGQVMEVDRFNQIGWEFQYDRVNAATKRWNVTSGFAELNSIGSPNLEQLQMRGLPWRGFTTTSQSKAELIQALAVAFEQREIQIPDDPVLIAELESYRAERLPSGRWRFGAPTGMHDDTVISLALAWQAKQRGGVLVDFA